MTDHEDDNEDEKLIRLACDAAMRNDTNALSEALHCLNSRQPNSSLHTPLLNSTREAQILHNRLFGNFSSEMSTPSGGRILRALFLMSPTYETPWSAALQFIESLHSMNSNNNNKSKHSARISRSSLRSTVTELQSFLQQTVSVWWEQERRRNSSAKPNNRSTAEQQQQQSTATTTGKTARDWILRLVQTLVNPLILHQPEEDGIETQQPNSRRRTTPTNSAGEDSWMLPLELVSTIVSTMHDFETLLNGEILDIVFALPCIRPDRLLAWLSLATDLHSFLRPSDWTMLLRTLQRTDNSSSVQEKFTAFSARGDFPGLMTAIVSLSSTLLLRMERDTGGRGNRKRSNATRDIFRAWKEMALNLLHAISTDPGTFSTVTIVFQERLSGLPSESLREWICLEDDGDEDDASENDTPNWVKANMLLAAMRSGRTSGSAMVDMFLSRALTNNKGHCDVSFEGWKTLVKLAYGNKVNESVNKKWKNLTTRKTSFKHVEKHLKGLSYRGFGRFGWDDQSANNSICNQVGELIYQSLFLKSTSRTTENSPRIAAIYVIDRAQDWISAANSRLKSRYGYLTSEEILVIAVAFIIVFCEVPMSRSFVVRGITQCLSGENDVLHSKGEIALLNCWIVSVIARSNHENLAGVNPIVDVLVAGKLETTIFIALVQAIVPTSQPAQKAILTLSRKRLQSSFGNILWDTENLNENCDRIRCSLFSLCSLIGLPDWNDNAAEAWKILSEVIVLNRPVLPVAARSWLFGQIERLLDSGGFPPESVVRLSRACLLRLLQFITNDASSSQAMIDPRSVFVVLGTDDARPSQCTPVEDIASLYKLVFSLFFRAQSESTRNSNSKRLIGNGYSTLLADCSNTSLGSQSTFSIQNESKEILHCTIAISLVFPAIGMVSALSMDELFAGLPKTSFNLDTKSVISDLILREEEAVNQRSLRPLWLDVLATSNHEQKELVTPPEAATRELAIELCSTVASLLKDCRWCVAVASDPSPNLQGQHKRLLQSLSFLSKMKKSLSLDVAPNPLGCCASLAELDAVSQRRECADIAAFFASSAIFVDHAISTKLCISEFNTSFAVIMDALDDLNDTLSVDENWIAIDNDLSSILYGIWIFYDRVSDESASVRLISYLEEGIATKTAKGPLDNLKHGIFLEGVESSDDIDIEIRTIRHSVLCVLQKCLLATLRFRPGSRLFADSPFFEAVLDDPHTICFRWSDKPGIRPLDFLSACLEKLVSDLQIGLDGHSGGVSMEMYGVYVESLDMVLTLLGLHVESGCNMQEAWSLHGRCSNSSEKLQAVLCSFPPKKKSSFMKAFLLLSRTLPILVGCTTRKALLSGDTASICNTHELEAALHGISFAVASFEDCTITLRRWIEREPLFLTCWVKADIPRVDDDAQSMLLDASSPIGDSIKRTAAPTSPQGLIHSEVPSIVNIQNESTPQCQHGALESGSKLPIYSKDVWSWICSGALLSMEAVWLDASEAMNHSVTTKGSSDNKPLPLSSSSQSYIQHRCSELSNICKALELAFIELEPGKANTDTTQSKDKEKFYKGRYLAEVFPNDAKHRLCSIIDRLVAATDVSLKVLDAFIHQTNDPPTTLSMMEACVCLIVFCQADGTTSLDFVHCFQRWHEAEKSGLRQSKDSEGTDFLRHFPRVLFRMEKLESKLHKLHTKLTGEMSMYLDQIKTLDGVLDALKTGTGGMSNDSEHSFCSMLKKRLDVLTEAQPKLKWGTQGTGALLSRVGKRKRKNRRQDFHRQPMRSRNATVDIWLRSDQEMADADDDDDAYLDLEDFVADG